MKTGLRDNNKGFSLVELLTVVAILALMLGMFLLSTNVIGRTAARQCSKQLHHELDRVRVASMGKNRVILHLYRGADNKVMVRQITKISSIGGVADTKYIAEDAKEAGSSRVSLEFISSVDAAHRIPLDGDGVYFEFNRSTGAFKKVNGSVIQSEISGDISGAVAGQVGGDYIIENIFITGGGLTETLTMHQITGKVTED